jgi:hypothetical protein
MLEETSVEEYTRYSLTRARGLALKIYLMKIILLQSSATRTLTTLQIHQNDWRSTDMCHHQS